MNVVMATRMQSVVRKMAMTRKINMKRKGLGSIRENGEKGETEQVEQEYLVRLQYNQTSKPSRQGSRPWGKREVTR